DKSSLKAVMKDGEIVAFDIESGLIQLFIPDHVSFPTFNLYLGDSLISTKTFKVYYPLSYDLKNDFTVIREADSLGILGAKGVPIGQFDSLLTIPKWLKVSFNGLKPDAKIQCSALPDFRVSKFRITLARGKRTLYGRSYNKDNLSEEDMLPMRSVAKAGDRVIIEIQEITYTDAFKNTGILYDVYRLDCQYEMFYIGKSLEVED
ncbi:MAG: hypothetical protein AAF740_09225, partial [Bacteroidota bacterium]